MNSLELGLVGNGSFGALLDARGRVVWCCLPAFDGDPAFCALLEPKIDGGDWAVELEDFASSEQHYLPNTAILRTLLHDAHGGTVEQIDFARSAERRVGKACVRTCRSRWSPYH